MKMRELMQRLALGELRGLSVVDKTEKDVIRETDRPMIMTYANQALAHLYSRFILSEKNVLIETRIPYTHYYLRKEFARSNSEVVPYKYIDDSWCDDFEGDVVKILAVWNQLGQELFLNDIEQPQSLHTPRHDCLQITHNHFGTHFNVTYQAKHPELIYDVPERDVEVPFFLEEALQCYIAAKVIGHMNGQEHVARAQEHMARYEALCMEAEMRDLAQTSHANTNTKLPVRGFI